MNEPRRPLSFGTVFGALVALAIAAWLLVGVLRTIFWMVKVGIALALIAAVVVGISRLTNRRR